VGWTGKGPIGKKAHPVGGLWGSGDGLWNVLEFGVAAAGEVF
jgi:hypothetical protein